MKYVPRFHWERKSGGGGHVLGFWRRLSGCTLEPDYRQWWTAQVAQPQRICLPVRETRVWSLCWEDSLEKEMATHSSILVWRIPWTGDWGCKRVRHDIAAEQQHRHQWPLGVKLEHLFKNKLSILEQFWIYGTSVTIVERGSIGSAFSLPC